MGGVGPIAQRLSSELPRLEKAEEPKPGSPAWKVEAASIEISVKLNYVQLGGAADAPADNVAELLDKVRQWVKDIFEKNGLKWKELSPEEARKQIDQGGEQSPDAVSSRILDVVKGFYDGTPGRAQLLRDAVEKGFKDAEGAWGAKLPDVSYQTMEKVRAGLDGMFAAPKVDLAA